MQPKLLFVFMETVVKTMTDWDSRVEVAQGRRTEYYARLRQRRRYGHLHTSRVVTRVIKY